ncbi:MAG: four helix bundle protein [Gammaproteobacteria bacterium]|nr:four helix bundle protein [Gammaproteobacteria bacterium]MCB1851797.1 four helix bundle protein [Gammaproteobacteria bacterium]MCP5418534.1 four helix bundle protein [Chromatiaceae bacterium]
MDALKNLEVWRRACRFSVDMYRLSATCGNAGFRDQLGRSALSVASNIAEGYERTSVKERVHFLKIAKGSSAEAWTQLLIGMETGFIDRDKGLEKADEVRQIAKMLYRLIEYIEGTRN